MNRNHTLIALLVIIIPLLGIPMIAKQIGLVLVGIILLVITYKNRTSSSSLEKKSETLPYQDHNPIHE